MINKTFDAIVIGGGAAGMTAAVALSKLGHTVAIIERDASLGGVLNQCIHNGFGLHYFGEELTGPEYAERLRKRVAQTGIEIFLNSSVVSVEKNKEITVTAYSAQGVISLSCKALILSMGCRERNRGNIGISGSRPAGVFTAGLAQRLMNIEGYLPGKKAVIIGSGDIGLIMARRLKWCGCEVAAVIEILPHPSGLTRNIVQCLNDFNIPLYLSHSVTQIIGKNRVTGVEVSPMVNGNPDPSTSFSIDCDTVLLSVGLIPENEVSKTAGVSINPETGGAFVDANYMTSVPGIFSCGNVLHVHDLVDYVSEESERCAGFASEFIKNIAADSASIAVKTGSNLKYVIPNALHPVSGGRFYMRPLIVKQNGVLSVSVDGTVILEKKLQRVQPSEMIRLDITPEELSKLKIPDTSSIEIGVR
jgi:NADPH-dependent 2,4-dienoyl-CoA reductase/sulfur reductase-like enzyme